MKVIRLANLKDTAREVKDPRGGFTSERALLESDGMGFAMTRTTIYPIGIQKWHYKKHLEACYCVSGHGTLHDENGQEWSISPGTLYALDKHDKHTFTAHTEVVLICVFNPALIGPELHNEDGSYD